MYIADLHIHSRYSRATSKDLTPETLDFWAGRKGIHILGTGDFTHPAWREELNEKLVPAEEGFYTLKEEYRLNHRSADSITPRFVITGEISSIYKKNGKVRKVHSLILLPGLKEAEMLAKKLEAIGNIHSDGRPILGLDCRDLLEITMDTCPEAVYVPAHIWTPHFSLFGAFSGFDTIEECFEDMTPYVHALETGLSSDPPMNWRLSALDSYQLISNSDAHSPAKLGREANLLDIELSYNGLSQAIQTGKGLYKTLEFFPEEGKYHFDGHRKCHLSLTPSKAAQHQNICPVCGKKLTIGVLHRVEQLADREEGFLLPGAKPFESLVPLPEVIAASAGLSAASTKVQAQYEAMLGALGTEFEILRHVPEEDILRCSGPLVAEGIKRLRSGKVDRLPGFDGEYGKIQLLSDLDRDHLEGQISFFTGLLSPCSTVKTVETVSRPIRQKTNERPDSLAADEAAISSVGAPLLSSQELNPKQWEAVTSYTPETVVIAGPGTGKTKTLVSRIAHLIENRGAKPSEITALTFTNKAADEMRDRLLGLPGGKRAVGQMHIGTFHSVCQKLLKDQGMDFTLAGRYEMEALAGEVIKETGEAISAKGFLRELSLKKSSAAARTDLSVPDSVFQQYDERLHSLGMLDFDDLLLETLKLLKSPDARQTVKKHFHYLLVDEFQDINPVQYELIKELHRYGKELFVIGDPDQSIYGFRGSAPECFASIKHEYPDLLVIQLEENYRSTPQIISGALSLIRNNPKNGSGRVLTPKKPGELPIAMVTGQSDMTDTIWIAKEINRLIGGIDMLQTDDSALLPEAGRLKSFSDIAVLYRTHRQVELLEKCLRKEGIPYIVTGREDFLSEKEVAGTISFFRWLYNPENTLSKNLCLKLFKQLDQGTLGTLSEKYEKDIKKSKPQKLIDSWCSDLGLEGSPAMKKLTDISLFYKNMKELLDALELGEENAIQRASQKHYLSDGVRLMTFHGSKGLEFPAVFVYGIKKGTVPFEFGEEEPNWEEERRLLYVAMTRARDDLFLLTAPEPSPFLEEIDPACLYTIQAGKTKPSDEGKQLSLFDFM